VATLAACPVASRAQGFPLTLSLEPGVALRGAQPGAGLVSLGAGSLKALLGVSPYLEVSVGVGFVGLSNLSLTTSSMSGMASTLGLGLRLMRPRDRRSFWGTSPWIDAEALRVQADGGDRRAFALGAGVAFPIGRARRAWLGPFVRYLQILEPNGAAPDRRASDGLFAGVALELAFPSGTWGGGAGEK
jgi:hypothetical protein